MRLKIAVALVYATFAGVGAAVIAPRFAEAWQAVSRPWSYMPNLVAPWLWLVLALALIGLLADLARRLAAARSVGMSRYVALLMLVALCFTARRLVTAPRRPTVANGLGHLIAKVALAADEEFDRAGTYPTDGRLLEANLPPFLRDLGYFEKGGRALHSRIHIRIGTEPTLLAPAEIRPGDLVFTREDSGHRYWLTAFRLSPRGRLEPFTGSGNRAVVSAGTDGTPESRVDPLFPIYPRKSRK